MSQLIRRVRPVLCVASALMFAQSATAQEKFSYRDLVHRLIDLEHVAVLPAA